MSVTRIAQLSDLHFGTIKPGVAEGLRRTLERLRPDLILITGDVTQRAKAREFAAAGAFVKSLVGTVNADGGEPNAARAIVVPGNHDVPLWNVFGRAFDPYRGFRRTFGPFTERDFVRGDIVVTSLNSTSRWRHVQGAFDLKRLDRRLAEFERRPERIRIAAFHHPLDCAKPQDEQNLIKRGDRVVDVLGRHAVDLVIGGHIHDPYVTLSSVRYPGERRTMVFGVAGTATSWRTRKGAPNSFNFIEADTGGVPRLSITRFDQGADLEFSIVRSHAFIRSSDAGWSVV